MALNTKIEWAANADGSPGATWNPIRARNRETGKDGWFCVHESEGCRNCYAERINTLRFGNGVAYKAQNESQVEIFLDEKKLLHPLRWRNPRTIFVCSMSDLFGAFVPDGFIDRVFAIAALRPQHTFIVLTKRAKRMREYMARPDRSRYVAHEAAKLDMDGAMAAAATWDRVEKNFTKILPNVWLGISAEDQKTADARIPDLLSTPAAIRFVSLEPLLGPIELDEWLKRGDAGLRGIDPLAASMLSLGEAEGLAWVRPALDWVIVGGESGPGARIMRPDWARSLRDQCHEAGVHFFFKQWGEWGPYPHWPEERSEISPPIMEIRRVGKRAAGRLLDGVEHNARPALTYNMERSA